MVKEVTKMDSKELLNCLFESSSLRQDLLEKVRGNLIDILDNIDLNDELCARVNDSTYQFIKDYKLN